MPPVNPHFAFPLTLTPAGDFAVVEQDELPEVRQCVIVLLGTPRGGRALAPDVGIPDPTFTTGIDPGALEAQLMDPETGEPRARVTVTTTAVSARTGRQGARVDVQLAASTTSGVTT